MKKKPKTKIHTATMDSKQPEFLPSRERGPEVIPHSLFWRSGKC